MTSRFRAVLVAAGFLAVAMPASAQAAPGDPDFSFGTGGQVIYGDGWEGHAVALQRDGKVVVAGQTSDFVGGDVVETFLILRLNPNGSLDPSFSSDGVQTIGFGPDTYARAFAVDVGPDGKIVVAGAAGTQYDNVAVARLLSNGSPDSSFSGDGKLVTGLDVSSDAEGVVVQLDGKVVVAGYQNNQDFDANDFDLNGTLLIRYSANGALDSQFGSGGAVRGSRFDDEAMSALALMPDGRIVTVGSCCFPTFVEPRLHRFAPNGTEDTAFAQRAEASNLYAYGNDLALLPDGRVLVAGDVREPAAPGSLGNYELGVARFLPSGALDSSFGSGGVRYVRDFDGRAGSPTGIGLQPDDRIAVAGLTSGTFSGSSTDVVATRLIANGEIDSAFGRSGRVRTNVDLYDVGSDMVVQPDGKLVVAGYTESDDRTQLVVLRYLAAGSNQAGTGPPVPCPEQTDDSVRCFDSSTSAPTRCASSGLPRKRRKYLLTMIGSKKGEMITGTRGANLIIAAGGNDRVFAKGGRDCVLGGPGADQLFGAAGSDALAGEKGGDVLDGGGGGDALVGGPGSETIYPGGGRDRVKCGPGRDFVQPRRGGDRISASC